MSITRRAALSGAIASSVALAVPAAKAVNTNHVDAMPPVQRAEHYARKLTEALNEMNPGAWRYTYSAKDGLALLVRDASAPVGIEAQKWTPRPQHPPQEWVYTRVPIPGIG